MSGNIFFSLQDVGKHECPIHQFNTPPEIDFHLLSVGQVIFLIKDWAVTECLFLQ